MTLIGSLMVMLLFNLIFHTQISVLSTPFLVPTTNLPGEILVAFPFRVLRFLATWHFFNIKGVQGDRYAIELQTQSIDHFFLLGWDALASFRVPTHFQKRFSILLQYQIKKIKNHRFCSFFQNFINGTQCKKHLQICHQQERTKF